MSYEDYLEYNERHNVKMEYLGGVVYAMAGGTNFHARLSGTMITALSLRLRSRGCFTLSSDVLVATPAKDAVFYPDATVICGKMIHSTAPIGDPILVVEVLSASTRKYDLGTKFEQYKLIPSLRHIIFVDAQAVGAQVFTRAEGQVWPGFPLTYISLTDSLELSELAISIPLAELYEDLEF